MVTKFERRLMLQEELSKKYFRALTETESSKIAMVSKLEKQLKQQKKLSRHNYHDLLQTESTKNQKVTKLKQEIKQHKIQIQQLIKWMRQLDNAFQALTRIGRRNARSPLNRIFETLHLRSPKPLAIDSIQDIFGKFYIFQDQIEKQKGAINDPLTSIGEQLLHWMEQLQSDFESFVGSYRWRLGNSILYIIDRLLFRPKVILATEDMVSIFSKFDDWQKNVMVRRSGRVLYEDEINQLENWLTRLDNDFQAILISRRWQVGNAIISILRGMTFQRKTFQVADHMQGIFITYRKIYGE